MPPYPTTCRQPEQAAIKVQPAGRRSPAFFPGGQSKILEVGQGFSESSGGIDAPPPLLIRASSGRTRYACPPSSRAADIG